MAHIQSVMAEIRREKNRQKKKEEPQDESIMSTFATQGGQK